MLGAIGPWGAIDLIKSRGVGIAYPFFVGIMKRLMDAPTHRDLSATQPIRNGRECRMGDRASFVTF
ncbi:MAG: hypothetical protein EA001_04740 [Oscillatoriales cyanobacterium]|nr:MAG: hypothetical protein EA001_04740 [Oscillatoriales cyanobacterium]